MTLYEIEGNLLNLFSDIEEEGGVITPEQEELLAINEKNLKEKLNNYRKAVLSWDSDADALKCEAKRLTDRRKVYENRVERLKKSMLDAVEMFGDTGKTGNKFIELPEARIFTKASSSVNVDEERVKFLITLIIAHVNEIYQNGALVFGEEVDVDGMMAVINANARAERETDYTSESVGKDEEFITSKFIPFTTNDLKNIKIEISTEISLFDLVTEANPILPALLEHSESFKITHVTPKEEFKKAIAFCEQHNDDDITVAAIEKKNSLQIK
jgi:hypothetical protein